MTHEKPLIVVLGLGEMGLIHAKNLSTVRQVRLGLASTRASALHQAANAFCADRTYPSYAAAFADDDVKAVIIATAPSTHPDLIRAAARAKKNILCEKPLGYDSASIRDCVRVAAQNDVALVVAFMRRWDRAFETARERVTNSHLGRVTVMKCISGDAEYPDKYQRDASKNKLNSMLLDLAVHDIDMARWLLQSEVNNVYVICDALTYPSLKGRGDCDVAVGVLQMTCGAKVILHLSRALSYGYTVTSEVFGTDGRLQIGAVSDVQLTMLKKGRSCRDVDSDFPARFEKAFESEVVAFAKLMCFKGAREIEKQIAKDARFATGRDGLMATIVAEALVKSDTTGMPQCVTYDQ